MSLINLLNMKEKDFQVSSPYDAVMMKNEEFPLLFVSSSVFNKIHVSYTIF